MELLLERLAGARIGSTHNQYQGPGGDVRLANLAAYLEERAAADVVAIGEAAGYQGARWSGIAFTSERDLARWGPPYRPTSPRPEGYSEPSGTIVHTTLEGLAPSTGWCCGTWCRRIPIGPTARSPTAGRRRPRSPRV